MTFEQALPFDERTLTDEDRAELAEHEAADAVMKLCKENHAAISSDDCCEKCGWGMK